MEALLKVRKIGNGAGIILPEEFLAHLGVQIGDNLEVETTEDGILLRALPGRNLSFAGTKKELPM